MYSKIILLAMSLISMDVSAYTMAGRAKVCSIVLIEATTSATRFAAEAKDKTEKQMMMTAANTFRTAREHWDRVYTYETLQGRVSDAEYQELEDMKGKLNADPESLFTLTKESTQFCVNESKETPI